MMTQIIDYNLNDFEENIHDFFTFMYYKGQPFTGTLKDEDFTVEFKNGNAEGLAISYFPNGQISSETEYKNGKFVQEKDWYVDGEIKSSKTVDGHFKYAKNGKLAYESKLGLSIWYYKNGAIKQREIWHTYQTSYYASNGQLAIEIERINEIYFAEYIDNVLIANFKEVITNFYPELDDLSSNLVGDLSDHFPKYCFQLWVLKLLIEKPSVGREVLNELENFADDKVKSMAYTIKEHLVDFSLDEVAKGDYGYCGYKIKNYR